MIIYTIINDNNFTIVLSENKVPNQIEKTYIINASHGIDRSMTFKIQKFRVNIIYMQSRVKERGAKGAISPGRCSFIKVRGGR